MRIGLIGGTGKAGSGLAMRWARRGHQVLIGSRDESRGHQRAKELSKVVGTPIQGGTNHSTTLHSEVIVVCVPYSAHQLTFGMLNNQHRNDSIVLDMTVPLKPPKVQQVQLPQGQSAALEAAEILGEKIKLVSCLHHISAAHLSNLDHSLDCDILVCGDHQQAKSSIIDLVSELGARALDAGPLANSIALEALTPVLIQLNQRYSSTGTGIRITGL